jgi:predicted dehydrogenase
MRVANNQPKNMRKPRLGFLGVGWIGRNRMEAVAKSGLADIFAIADSSSGMTANAVCSLQKLGIPAPAVFSSLGELIEQNLDGVVIATPSALHAEQSIACLQSGIPVFCQKPLARNGEETRCVIAAARENDCSLGVDLSYRHLDGAKRIREMVERDELGKIFAVELAFHNAYGPGKGWFYDAKLSGGGCVIDLGIHLVDLALWVMGSPEATDVRGRLFQQGLPLHEGVEDYAAAQLDFSNDVAVQLSCSWRLPVGCDAIISAAFYGTKGGAVLKNVNGSFYEFTAEHCVGTTHTPVCKHNENWQSGAILEWVRELANGGNYDCEVEHLIETADALDAIYGHERNAAAVEQL